MERDKLFKLIDLHLEEKAGVPSNRGRRGEFRRLANGVAQKVRAFLIINCSMLVVALCGLVLGAISYLTEGNYFGVEVWEPYMKLGQRILEEFKITKQYTMKIDRDFDYEVFGEKFEFAIAQSVVTHLSVHQIDKLLKTLKKVMKSGGVFLLLTSIDFLTRFTMRWKNQ